MGMKLSKESLGLLGFLRGITLEVFSACGKTELLTIQLKRCMTHMEINWGICYRIKVLSSSLPQALLFFDFISVLYTTRHIFFYSLYFVHHRLWILFCQSAKTGDRFSTNFNIKHFFKQSVLQVFFTCLACIWTSLYNSSSPVFSFPLSVFLWFFKTHSFSWALFLWYILSKYFICWRCVSSFLFQ